MPLSQIWTEYPGSLPGTTQALELENREVGGVGNAAADLSSSTKCVKLILIGLHCWIPVALDGPDD